MGKSIRSKIKKRLRTVKRQRVDAMICTPREAEHNEALHRVMEGRAVTMSRVKNAFKYPKEDGACFPQHEIMKPIDFRAQNLPMAGYVFKGNRRKYAGEQAEFMDALKKTSHPKMEVLAGGGAVLARDGRRVTMREAEILATAAAGRPEAAAQAASAPSTAASAVEAALNEDVRISTDSRGDAEMGGNAEIEHPKGAADHSRRPIVKDTRRIARTAEARPRTISSKKKTRGKHLQAADNEADVAPAAKAAAPAESAVKTKVKKNNLKKKRAGGKAAEEGMDED